MLSSQAVETGIGLALMMFIFAVATSSLLDLGRRLLNIRSKDLEVALMSFFDSQPQPGVVRVAKAGARLVGAVGAPKLEGRIKATKKVGANPEEPESVVPGSEAAAWAAFQATAVYRGVKAARHQVRPAYLSAKAFADAVEEMLDKNVPLTGPLKERIASSSGSLRTRRAELEGWFDEAMAGLSGRYQKKSTIWLFVLGTLLAGVMNASFPHVAHDLWQDDVTRAAVVAAAEKLPQPSASTTPGSAREALSNAADAADDLHQVGLPLGWAAAPPALSGNVLWWTWHGLGWLMTGLLASFGGPFWYDIFGRLTAARSSKPPTATNDETSATRALVRSVQPPRVRPLR